MTSWIVVAVAVINFFSPCDLREITSVVCLCRFLISLGIRCIGAEASEIIAKEFGTFDQLWTYLNLQFGGIEKCILDFIALIWIVTVLFPCRIRVVGASCSIAFEVRRKKEKRIYCR